MTRPSSFFSSLIILTAMLSTIHGQVERGGSVRVHDTGGQVRDIPLYKQSYALLIGNSKYANWNDLPGVSRDIVEVKNALTSHGFNVVSFNDRGNVVLGEAALNLTRDQFRRQIELFIDEFGQDIDNRLLIYYAGHGYTAVLPDGRKMGYLVMQDAPSMPPVEDALSRGLSLVQLASFSRSSINMDQIESYAKSITSRHVLFIFDSCFAGTVLWRGADTRAPAYISQEDLKPVREFLTAGNELQRVSDDSSFRKAFVRGIEGAADSADDDNPRDGYVLGSELFAYIKKELVRASASQTPVFGKISTPELARGDFIFITDAAARPLPVTTSSAPTATPLVPTKSAELIWWETVQNSSDPNDFEKFVAAYPKSVYAEVAKFKRDKLRASAEMARFRNPKQGMTLSREIAPGINMEFVGIPSGEFTMGMAGERARGFRILDEAPHKVAIKEGFWMGKYEVTEKQWKSIMSTKLRSSGCDECPANELTWLQVKQFLQKLNELNDGFEYRLPSEAEWEYAARANTKTRFYWGDGTELICFYANVRDTKSAETNGMIRAIGEVFNCNDGYAQLAPVGKFQGNGFGLFDMIGNASEWCEDVYSYDTKNVPRDGSPNTSNGEANERVQRGGSYFSGDDPYDALSVASRSGAALDMAITGGGFRVVAIAKPH